MKRKIAALLLIMTIALNIGSCGRQDDSGESAEAGTDSGVSDLDSVSGTDNDDLAAGTGDGTSRSDSDNGNTGTGTDNGDSDTGTGTDNGDSDTGTGTDNGDSDFGSGIGKSDSEYGKSADGLGAGVGERSAWAGEGRPEVGEQSFIDPAGMNAEERIRTPQGYTRVQVTEDSFGEFLRQYPLEEDGAEVYLYDGRKKGNQSAHVAVYKLPVIDRADVQQCADSVMRMYAEYFYATGQMDRIAFHFVDGFLFDYASYRDGRRVSVGERSSSWTDGGSYDDSYERFEDYLYIAFAYSSTLSMVDECETVDIHDVQAGDVFLYGGSPGHVVMVVDVCENAKGERAFLLAQGYMPAQQFHILKNPAHENDPWYYVEETEVGEQLRTPEYTFEKDSFMRPRY